jgi:hypothetical protein
LREGNNSMHMRFYVLAGTAETGLRFANQLNTDPSYRVSKGADGLHYSKIVPSADSTTHSGGTAENN